jgi:hypothetical protein
MKKIILITSAVILIVVFFACTQNRPEPVVEKYYTHYYRNEFKEIQEYVMPEHCSYFKLLDQFYEGNDTLKKTKVKITDVKCDITGDSVAICTCLVQEEDKEPQKQIVQLKKLDKKWLINQGKEGVDPMNNNIKNEDPLSEPVSSTETVSSNEEIVVKE